MRILVLDESRVLHWVVEQLVPDGVEVEHADSYGAAVRLVREQAPDAAIVSLSLANIPWHEFQRLCADHEPPIPVLYESCVHATAAEAGVQYPYGYADFVAKPMHNDVLQGKLVRLVEEAERVGGV